MNNIPDSIAPDWWKSEGGFFGKLYAQADDSLEGFLNQPLSMNQRLMDEVEGVMRLTNTQPASRLMDCPSGYGRHSLGLAQKGLEVTGVDINDEHLELAEQSRQKRGIKNVRWIKRDMRDLDFAEEFDAAINMFYSFGFFQDEADDQKSIENFYRALKPGGKWLMHTFITIPKIRAGNYKKHDVRTLTSGNKLELYRDFDETTKREIGTWSIVKPDGSREELAPYSMRIYDTTEYEAMTKKAGFSKCEAFGDWKGTPYTPESELLIFVATK